MLGFVYIVVCFLAGFTFCTLLFPKLYKITEVTFDGKRIKLSPYFILLPAWYYTGTLIVTWSTYLLAYFIGSREDPLLNANLMSLPLFLILFFIVAGFKIKKYIREQSDNKQEFVPISSVEGVFILGVFMLVFILMWCTFFIKGTNLYVGSTVFGDFSPHIGMIRSFSEGNNFPTWYNHFAGEDIRYHFMFFFMVGNLEYLGLPLDFAFNIPSMLSFIGAFMLLYVLSIKISGYKRAGYLSCLFFAFRSSKSLFVFLAQVPKGNSIFKALEYNTAFIGDTPNESWGLFNLNVYCNQRHLSFSIGVMLLVFLLYLPHLYALFDRLKQLKGFKDSIHQFILTKNSWEIKDYRLAVGAGILLGLIAFWNGSVLIAALAMLFIVGLSCERRAELLISAMIALVFAIFQSSFFIDTKAVNPTYFFGFIAENKTVFGVADYLLRLLGIFPFVLFAAFMVSKGIKRYLIVVFLIPLILTFHLSLTVDVTVNHKFIMISVILLGVMISDYLVGLMKRRDWIMKLGVGFIIILMTVSGLYDFYVLVKRNSPDSAIVLNLQSKLTKWIVDNSDSKDIFLTSNYSLNQIVLGGAMLFEGWQYFGWSAGYDTHARDVLVKEMYEAQDSDKLNELVKKNNIRFIVVDYDNRTSEDYHLNEENIVKTFSCVYTEGSGDYKLSIYDTDILLTEK